MNGKVLHKFNELYTKRNESKERLKNSSDNEDLLYDLEYQNELIDQIKRAYHQNNLVLVLGAGVSKSCNVPAWNELINLLLASTLDVPTNTKSEYASIFNSIYKPNSLIAARYVKNWFNNSNEYLEEIRRILYRNVEQSNIINGLSKLCANQSNSKIDSVITYNYDDLLEKSILKLTNNNFKLNSFFSNTINSQQDSGLNIYHVHGFLPSNGSIDIDKNQIVLGDDTYHELYLESDKWQNKKTLDKLKYKTCLFIGVSLTDPNMRRLLDFAKDKKSNTTKHYIIKRRINIDEAISKVQLFQKSESNDSFQRIISLIDSKYPYNLKKQIMLFEEKDAMSLGINTCWINEHDDIINIVDKIINHQ